MENKSIYPLNWNLSQFAPEQNLELTGEALAVLKKELGEVGKEAQQLSQYTNNPDEFTKILINIEKVICRLEDLYSVVICLCAEEAENTIYRQWEGELTGLMPAKEDFLTALETCLGRMDDESFSSLCKANSEAGAREKFLILSRKSAKYRLEEEQEKLANELDVHALAAWERLYDYHSSRIRIKVIEKGEVVLKSPSQVSLNAADRSLRVNNFYAASKAWEEIAEPCALALNQISGARLTRYKRLNVVDHLDLPIHNNRLQRKTLETMWSTIVERKSSLGTYFKEKARLLGLEKLSWYDIDAPLPIKEKMPTLSYADACEEIVACFHGFSGELGEFAEMSLRENWVEAENRAGKRQGGFCTGLPGFGVSRIFMTYLDNREGQSTLAHELGHAYHSYVMRDLPVLLQAYPMNLAETASTFAETVMNEYTLKHAETDAQKLLVLDRMLQDSVAFLMNIHCRFLFEDEFYRRRKGGELSAADLSDLMVHSQKEAYLNLLDEEGYNPTFWISKLHFYISEYPFYNFPYTFGYMLSQGLYRIGQENGSEFPQQLVSFLRKTGSEESEACVSLSFGKDLTQADFWNFVIDIIDTRIAEFCKLSGTIS